MQREERPASSESKRGPGAAEGSETRPSEQGAEHDAPERTEGTTEIPQGLPVSPEEFQRMKRAAERPRTDPDPNGEDEDDQP